MDLIHPSSKIEKFFSIIRFLFVVALLGYGSIAFVQHEYDKALVLYFAYFLTTLEDNKEKQNDRRN